MPMNVRNGPSSGAPGLPPTGSAEPARDWWQALLTGARRRCPSCGQGAMFSGYLAVNDHCDVCGTGLHHHRADDAPPYVVMFITGHVLVGGLLALERAVKPDAWVHLAIWLPLTVILSAYLLPRVKGALIGLQWAHRMHGFGEDGEPRDPLAPKLPDPGDRTV